MRTALVMMTILGCDDSGNDCQYIATLQQRWPTIELCNAVSEKELASFANVSYPVVIAVCQDPTLAARPPAGKAPVPTARPEQPQQALTPAEEREQEQSLAQTAINRVKDILPSREAVGNVVTSPVRMVQDGYAWVARRLR
ncbi:hypothetical protein SAMN05880590_10753 [Rhizobium sp. RU35A]|uniref:hypothetical protein n=1 Tax=Rhizobium sp. RU35A TaxID=1907414 RepID=UPI0009567E05|nr:hypothetical protein [Rhizobium sp. RU35A]SIQ76210.1 hypothetical protein SAMN05880590_10753 [Rhizobium sp. RU35A]